MKLLQFWSPYEPLDNHPFLILSFCTLMKMFELQVFISQIGGKKDVVSRQAAWVAKSCRVTIWVSTEKGKHKFTGILLSFKHRINFLSLYKSIKFQAFLSSHEYFTQSSPWEGEKQLFNQLVQGYIWHMEPGFRYWLRSP